MQFLIGAIEPVLYVYIVNQTLDVKNKKLVKNLLTYILFYGSILCKQFAASKLILVLVAFLPFIFCCILPKIIYMAKIKACIRIVICFISCSYLTDCILFLWFQRKEPQELAVFITKLMGVFVFVLLHKVFGIIKRNFPECFVVGGFFVIAIISLWVAIYFVTDDVYKIYAFVVQVVLLTSFSTYAMKSINQHMRKEMMEISAQELRSLKHEVRNHYNLIYTMYQENRTEELEEYFKKLNLEVNKNCLCSSSNVVLEDAVNHTICICNEEQIQFQYTLLTEEIPLNSVQQNVVLRNILNNAVEACRRCQGERYIHFSVQLTDYGETLIECRNSSLEVNENLLTSKKNKREHGIGIPTIRRIIKGKGKMMYHYSSGEFWIKILLGG